MVKEAEPRQFTVKQADSLLRDVPTKESVLNGIKRIFLFKGIDAVKYLMNKKSLLTSEAKTVLTVLLDNHYIVRVCPSGDQHTLDISYEFNINHEYIWLKEGSKTPLVLMSIAGVLICLTIAMFPIWPRSIKIGTGYLFYVLLGIVGFLVFITIFRYILNVLLWLSIRRSFWIFPNLYADCGVIESFIPLYGWDEEEGAQVVSSSQDSSFRNIKEK